MRQMKPVVAFNNLLISDKTLVLLNIFPAKNTEIIAVHKASDNPTINFVNCVETK